MKKTLIAAAMAVLSVLPAHADHRVVDYYYTISVPNNADGELGTLNYRTTPHGMVVGHFDVKAPKLDDGTDGGLTMLMVTEKKGKWWYVSSRWCEGPGFDGWVNSKYLVAHPIYSDDGCMC
jgi:hypothetical protein